MPAPKLAPGQKDGRVRSGRKPKPEGLHKNEVLKVGLLPEEKEKIMALGGSKWAYQVLMEALRAAELD